MTLPNRRIPIATWSTMAPLYEEHQKLIDQRWKAFLEARWTDVDEVNDRLREIERAFQRVRDSEPKRDDSEDEWDRGGG